ncbi:MAG: hypothetical protein M0Z31_11655 [Clostridia bacterium]|nr:hypothetical protein [Clostridia bacterium]
MTREFTALKQILLLTMVCLGYLNILSGHNIEVYEAYLTHAIVG